MAYRRAMGRGESRRSFNSGKRVKRINRPRPSRGGIRL